MSSTTVSGELVFTGLRGTGAALDPFMPHWGTCLALNLSTMGTSSCQGVNSFAPATFTGSPFWANGIELILPEVMVHWGSFRSIASAEFQSVVGAMRQLTQPGGTGIGS